MHCLQEEMICDYRKYLYEEEKSQATIEKYVRDIRHFYQYLKEGKSVAKEICILYKEYLMDRYKVSSVNSMLIALNRFFDYVGWDDCKVKGVKVQRTVFCSEEKELTKKEYIRLLDAAGKQKDKRLYYMIQTICATGIRISELKCITIEGLKKGKLEVYSKGKHRKIFVPSDLRKELLRYAARGGRKNGSVFVTKQGNAVNRSNIWMQMKRLCGVAEVAKEKVFPHNLRHLFAATFYQMKKDLVKLADILGHSNVETTRIYTVSTGKEHEKQVGSLGLVMV